MSMTYPNPWGIPPATWNGPICPHCNRPYIQTTITTGAKTFSYKPKHRKEGPAQ